MKDCQNAEFVKVYAFISNNSITKPLLAFLNQNQCGFASAHALFPLICCPTTILRDDDDHTSEEILAQEETSEKTLFVSMNETTSSTETPIRTETYIISTEKEQSKDFESIMENECTDGNEMIGQCIPLENCKHLAEIKRKCDAESKCRNRPVKERSLLDKSIKSCEKSKRPNETVFIFMNNVFMIDSEIPYYSL